MNPSGPARFCPTCGQALPGPVQRCPRCGANIGAAVGVQKKKNTAVIVVVVLVAAFAGISCLGILAAIAIPNFVKYQLRAKQTQVTGELADLAKAEQALAQRTGTYVALEGFPAAEPSPARSQLSADELAKAASIDWPVMGATYGQYRVAVSMDGTAASLCGESDIDGDGQLAAFVVFLPGEAAPPAAPCAEPVDWRPEYAPGEVIRVTDPNTF